MRLLILVILVLQAELVVGQSDSLNITITEVLPGAEESGEYLKACDKEKQRAVIDIQAGVLAIENYIGLPFKKGDLEFENFYTNYLIVNYKIKHITTGCTSPSERTCYFEEMNKAITAKYGSLFLQNLESVAQKEYENFKLFDNVGKKKYLDFSYAYERVDERATYAAGIKDLQNKLKERIDFKKFDLTDFKLYGFHTEVIIDESGNVVSCRVVSKNFPQEASAAVQEVVKEIGGWKPAVLYGSRVKSRTGFSFIF